MLQKYRDKNRVCGKDSIIFFNPSRVEQNYNIYLIKTGNTKYWNKNADFLTNNLAWKLVF